MRSYTVLSGLEFLSVFFNISGVEARIFKNWARKMSKAGWSQMAGGQTGKLGSFGFS